MYPRLNQAGDENTLNNQLKGLCFDSLSSSSFSVKIRLAHINKKKKTENFCNNEPRSWQVKLAIENRSDVQLDIQNGNYSSNSSVDPRQLSRDRNLELII